MITLALIGFVGGLITGISPCVLPVLPVIFLSAGAGGGARDARRPLLVVLGLTLSFSVFTVLGSLVLRALPVPQDIIRWAGIAILALLGVGMIVPRFEALLERPFARLAPQAPGRDRGGFLLGLALGAVYVPCAGPVLAAITVAGATGRFGPATLALTLAFALGTAIPLLIFALAGWRITDRLRAFRTRQRGIRVVAGSVVVALAVALTFNVTDAVQRTIPDYTSALNSRISQAGDVARALAGGERTPAALAACQQLAGQEAPELTDCGPAPRLTGLNGWLNTPGGAPADLTGKVVLVDFWAYSCINCQRAIPHVNAWAQAYAKNGLEVVGVHTPEYAFEHDAGNVAAGAKRLDIRYPIALDNDFRTWDAFHNQSWPADYLIDSTGRLRYVGIGEGQYPETEQLIRELLTSAYPDVTLPAATDVPDRTPTSSFQSGETYLGAARAQYYRGDTPLRPGTADYTLPKGLADEQYEYGLAGTWTVTGESITAAKNAVISLNYAAADIYLDLSGTGTLTVTAEGRTRTYAVGGVPNLYTVLHRPGLGVGTLTASLSPGLSAYSFTFG
ncbi:cytochrome c biogenesis protein CcdA [Actinoplanes sp. L3-i22]|uniref:cytochrome c biogenesis protein CcdA n=1 Tax=Actinoplanes sp. L3-i22 TaxID=2836373 RepID=UPI001C78A507|nr:cytochrome c biogenesis protein CcdA [Actinoplanes sp. L3-i22]BCY08955.1 protein DipZ [Actinoplanes sp. L3-i22]